MGGGGLFGANTNTPTSTAFSGFGASSSGSAGFGAFKPAVSAFGAPAVTSSGGLFGSTSQAPSGGLFGATPGATTLGGFGATATPFGSTTTPFGAQASVSGTTIKFTPPTGTDTMMKSGGQQNINTRHQVRRCKNNKSSILIAFLLEIVYNLHERV